MMKPIKNILKKAVRIAPAVGAVGGGVAGAAAGVIFGPEAVLVGGGAGGAAGYVIQKAADRIGELDTSKNRLPAKMVGSIPTDISSFVGRKSTLLAMRNFCTAPNGGVLLLFGFGGCGKSAALSKGLQEQELFFPGSRNSSFSACFSWSFSQNTNLESFFKSLSMYLDPIFLPEDQLHGEEVEQSYFELVDKIIRSRRRILLVLDGIEAVATNSDTVESSDGSVATPALRALLQRASEQASDGLKMICTSRVVPPELAGVENENIVSIDLNEMSQSEAITLLKKKGVKGTKKQLEKTALKFRYHAYSIALLGDLIRSKFRGDLRQIDQLFAFKDKLDVPMHAILDWYEDQLSSEDVQTLGALAVFRSPALEKDVERVASFVGETNAIDTVSVAPNFRSTTEKLISIGLVFASRIEATADNKLLSMHPIIREYYYQRQSNPLQLHQNAREILEARLPESVELSSSEELKLVKEVIFQALGSGNPQLAWRIYQDRIGGYPVVGYAAADHPTGTEIVDMFLRKGAEVRDQLAPNDFADMFSDSSLYLKNQGRLDGAISVLRHYEKLKDPSELDSDRTISNLLVRAGIELLRGRIVDSYESIREAEEKEKTATLQDADRARIRREILTRRAALRAVEGKSDTFAQFERAARIPLEQGTIPHDYGPIRHIWALTQQAQFQAAEEIAVRAITELSGTNAVMLERRVETMAALNAAWQGDTDSVKRWLQNIHGWTLKADIHIFVLNYLVRGVADFIDGKYETAQHFLRNCMDVSGNNGFLLEWLDSQVLLSALSLLENDIGEARTFADAALLGNDSDFFVPLDGAKSRFVNYSFASVAADHLLEILAEQRNIDSSAGAEELSVVGSPPNVAVQAFQKIL